MAEEIAPKHAHVMLLKQAVINNAVQAQYSAALGHYDTLIEVSGGLGDEDPLFDIDKKIRQTLNSPQRIEYQGAITKCEYCLPVKSTWRHQLNRSRFSINQVVGEIDEIELICGVNSVSLKYEPEIVWSVEQGWGECLVQVTGVEGATFQFLELNNEA